VLKLKTEVEELCFSCHEHDKDRKMLDEAWVHGPTATGECFMCHDWHQSDVKDLLIKSPPGLCYDCHEDTEEIFEVAENVHSPVEDGDCTACHSPHGTAQEFFLRKPIPKLCFTTDCHDDLGEEIEEARVDHEAVRKDRKCLNCHDPHVSPYETLLAKPPLDLCLGCHDKEIKASEKKIMNIKAWLDGHDNWHKPIKEKNCAGCHNPHGSPYYKILKAYYPKKFYTPFSLEKYDLCWQCHETKGMVLEKVTTKSTNFRNGDENLHYLHVNRKKKGRTCRACHDIHASNSPKIIRKRFPFGKKTMPINYKKTETGGSCLPGCHKRKKYDRVIKVVNK